MTICYLPIIINFFLDFILYLKILIQLKAISTFFSVLIPINWINILLFDYFYLIIISYFYKVCCSCIIRHESFIHLN